MEVGYLAEGPRSEQIHFVNSDDLEHVISLSCRLVYLIRYINFLTESVVL